MAVNFNASGDYLRRTATVPDDAYWAYSVWCRPQSGSQYVGVISLANAAESDFLYIDADWSAGYFTIGNGSGWSNLASLTNGVWYHLYLYINGTTTAYAGARQVGSSSYSTGSIGSATISSETQICIGTYAAGTGFTKSFDIAAAKIWSGSGNIPSVAELQAEAFTYRPLRRSGLWAAYPLLTTNTGYLNDISGNGAAMTEAGTPTTVDGPPIGWGAHPYIIQLAAGGATKQLTGTAAAVTTTVAPGPHRIRQLASTSATVVSTTASLGAVRELAGTSSATTVTAAGILRVQQLTSTSAATLTTTAAVIRLRAFTSTSAAAVTTTAALAAQRELKGTSAAVTTTVAPGPLRVRPLSSTSSTAVTTVAALSAQRELTGTATVAVTTVAPGPVIVKALSSTSATAVTTAATIAVQRELTSTSATAVTTVGAIVAKRELTSTSAAAVTTPSQALTRVRPLSSTSAAAVTTSSPDLQRIRALSSTSATAVTTTAAIAAKRELKGTAAVAVTTVAALTKEGAADLAGTAAAATTTTATIAAKRELAGTAAAATTTVAPGPLRIRPLSSTSTTAATTVASLSAQRPLAGTSATTVTTTAAITTVTYQVSGVTKTNAGATLGSCEVFLIQNNGDDTMDFLAHTTSDGSGNYSFTALTGSQNSSLAVIAWKDLTPHVMDATDWVLTGVEE